jgi:catecholate siderophore receptor
MLASTIGFQNSGITRSDQRQAPCSPVAPKAAWAKAMCCKLQSDYSNTFNWGGKKHAVLTGVDWSTTTMRSATSYANPRRPRPTTTVGTPDNGAVVADGRAPVQWNTFTGSATWAVCARHRSLTDTLKLVAGLRYDDFKASPTATAAGSLSNDRSDSLFSPRLGADLPARCDCLRTTLSYGTSYNTSGDTYQFGRARATAPNRSANTPAEKSRNIEIGSKFELFERRACSVWLGVLQREVQRTQHRPRHGRQQELLSGKRHATGMEFNLAGPITPKWEVFFNHTWIPDAKIDQSNVARMPPAQAPRCRVIAPASPPSTAAACGAPMQLTPKRGVWAAA